MKEKTIAELLNFSIINIDKSAGPTSFSVSEYVRRKMGVKKSSHFGTLDPGVTGVLPIALGRACKLTGFFLGHDKTYVGVMKVHEDISLENLQEIINKKFLGKIMQLPPKKSRVKRQIREREIVSFELLEKDGKNFLFKTKVQGGTYIRKLVHDLGEQIGGAHMAELRRVEAGVFDESTSVSLYDFEKAVDLWENGDEGELRKILVPAEIALKKIMPFASAHEEEVKKLLTGKPVFGSTLKKIPEEDLFSVFFEDRFIGVYKKFKEDEIIAKAEFVFN